MLSLNIIYFHSLHRHPLHYIYSISLIVHEQRTLLPLQPCVNAVLFSSTRLHLPPFNVHDANLLAHASWSPVRHRGHSVPRADLGSLFHVVKVIHVKEVGW